MKPVRRELEQLENEPALKLYGNGGGYLGPVLEVFADDSGGTIVYGVDAVSEPSSRSQSHHWIQRRTLETGDTLPSGLADGTIVWY